MGSDRFEVIAFAFPCPPPPFPAAIGKKKHRSFDNLFGKSEVNIYLRMPRQVQDDNTKLAVSKRMQWLKLHHDRVKEVGEWGFVITVISICHHCDKKVRLPGKKGTS